MWWLYCDTTNLSPTQPVVHFTANNKSYFVRVATFLNFMWPHFIVGERTSLLWNTQFCIPTANDFLLHKNNLMAQKYSTLYCLLPRLNIQDNQVLVYMTLLLQPPLLPNTSYTYVTISYFLFFSFFFYERRKQNIYNKSLSSFFCLESGLKVSIISSLSLSSTFQPNHCGFKDKKSS